MILGGKHGDEVTGTNVLYYLIKHFDELSGIEEQLYILLNRVWLVIIPAINI